MKKNIVYIVLLAVLGAGVWYFLFSDKNVFGVNEADFTVKDTNAVHKIYLADKSGNAVTLERKEQGWVVNDQYPVLASSLNNLMKTMANQEAMYPVPEDMHNSVIRNMAAKAIKVELYNKKGEPMQVFYVGGQVGENAGSYMLMEGASKPYVVQIPGFEGYLTPRYSTRLDDWRDRTVFNVAPENLRSVAVSYPSEPLNNFVMSSTGKDKFDVKLDPLLGQIGPLNERRTIVYSGYFQNIYLEGYLNGLPGLDTMIAGTKKRCTVEVVAKDGKKQLVDIYWKPVGKRSKNLDVADPDVPEGFDSDRMYAVFNNNKDTALIQHATFGKIFKRGVDFYTADQQPTEQRDTAMPRGSIRIPVE